MVRDAEFATVFEADFTRGISSAYVSFAVTFSCAYI
jgi:hypothetical protein